MNTPITAPADVLDRAADLIEQRGLNKEAYIDNDTPALCALGALSMVVYNDPAAYIDHEQDLLPVTRPLAHTFGFDCDDSLGIFLAISARNDAEDTTAADVAHAIRTTARRLRQGGAS